MEINFASGENVEAYATREGSGIAKETNIAKHKTWAKRMQRSGIAKETNIFKEVFKGEAYATTRGSGIACQ